MNIFITFMDSHSYGVPAAVLFIACLLLLLFGIYRKRKKTTQHSVNQSSESGLEVSAEKSVQHEEEELIRNIKDFQDTIVREVMIPRIDIVAVEEATNLKEFRALALEKGHSRIPVYRKTIDQIVGIAYVKDMLHYWDADEAAITVASFMRPPYFVPETKNIGALLQEFQGKKVHIAVAIDEYGGTEGLVTIEDLLEVVFGEIVDEYDEEEEELVKVIDDNTFEVTAKAGIDELEEYVGELSIEQQDFDTVGGLLFAILGDVPKEQDVVEFRNLKFTILKADRHRILQIKVERFLETVEE